MKLIISALLVALLFSVDGAKAQQTHFIYIQTNNKQAFYVRMNNTVYSSSYSGYLILSKLVDSTYNFSIGFPKSEWPQQNFTCTIANNDKGFLLKNFGAKGWGLFNLQTLEVTMANAPAENKNIVTTERTDSFSNMLSAVVNDPGIKRTAVVKEEEVKLDTTQPVQKAKEVVTEEPAKPVIVPAIKLTVTKVLDKTNADGTELVYIDNAYSKQDTIRVFIPADKTIVAAQPKVDTEKVEEKPVVKQEPKTEDKKNIDVQTPVAANTNVDTPSKTIDKKITTEAKPAEVTNTNCKNIASEEDFLKLRKKMASEEDEDAMTTIANKVFKAKCFTTSQIRNLGFLFLTDKGRYKFFDMAYAFASDPGNFGTLQSQLTESYYVNRFKAMINQ